MDAGDDRDDGAEDTAAELLAELGGVDFGHVGEEAAVFASEDEEDQAVVGRVFEHAAFG